jgi:hypothetical protein
VVRGDLYFSADVEADGPIPGRCSMLSFGLAVAGSLDDGTFTRCDPTAATFYAELRPVAQEWLADAVAVAGLDRDRLLSEGEDPAAAMTRAAEWVRDCAGSRRPVLAAYPASFDWGFLHWYFVNFAEGGSPFGFSSVLDMKTMYAVKARVAYDLANKPNMPSVVKSSRPHTHNALDDAVEQADLLANLFEWEGP